MPQGIDDFTIVLSELTAMAACELKVYDGLDQLWRMVERYKMTAPIAFGPSLRPQPELSLLPERADGTPEVWRCLARIVGAVLN
jgi:hypothetical protein